MENYSNYNPEYKQVICKNVKKFRNEKNMRLMELAEIVDVSVDHLKRIEADKDRDNISLGLLYKISIALDVSIEKFFI